MFEKLVIILTKSLYSTENTDINKSVGILVVMCEALELRMLSYVSAKF